MAADARDEALASERGSSHTCDILLPGENVVFFFARIGLKIHSLELPASSVYAPVFLLKTGLLIK